MKKSYKFPEADPVSEIEDQPAPVVADRVIGGMTKTAWSGVPMWKCKKCGATTFEESVSKTHTCPNPTPFTENDGQ